MFCHGWQNKASRAMDGSLNAVYVTPRKSNSGILSFSYFRTTEQNKFGFVQFDIPKTENHLLPPESFPYIVDKETNMRYIKTEVIVDKETIFLQSKGWMYERAGASVERACVDVRAAGHALKADRGEMSR